MSRRNIIDLLIIDQEPLNLPFILSCVEHQHRVYWFKGDPKTNNMDIGNNFDPTNKKIIPVSNWVPYISKVDLTIACDNGKYIDKLDAFKKKGFKIYSPSVKSANLEIQRKDGLDFMKAHNIDVPKYHEFATLNEARKFLMKDKGRYVIKLLGDEDDKSLTYLSKTSSDMLEHFDWMEHNKKIPKDSFILQEYVKGIEFAISAWMGSKGFIGLPCESVEHKALCAGDVGPSTGEQGTLSKYTSKSKLFDELLKPLEKDLTAFGHLSNIDINSIIDEKGKVWPLEFTARFGYPAWQLNQQQHETKDQAQWMLDACNGKNTLKQNEDHGICVVINVPPYPFDKDQLDERALDRPIYGYDDTPAIRSRVQPQMVKIDKTIVQDGKSGAIKKRWNWKTAGSYVAIVNGFGDSITQSQERVYDTIKKLWIPGIYYRNDIGKRFVEEQLEPLQKLGFAESWRK